MDAKLTGKIILENRRKKGLNQLQLAELLNVSNRTVSKWENGDGFPDITLLPKIAEIFNITIDELLTGEKPEPIIVEIPAKEDKLALKIAKSKFTVSEIISFCMLLASSAIGIATEIALFCTRPFYAFIEIYLLVFSFIVFTASEIVFFTGYTKYKSDCENAKKSTAWHVIIFSYLSLILPLFVAYRMLYGVEIIFYIALIILVPAIISLTYAYTKSLKKIEDDKNEK